ncbi:hypothetical protein DUNSADRAFT_4582 [Dunaliella salina]|nr:hypothetical protein DUNSADRAFT_4582 [Dunaliella salina]|eukprot:KAF5826139.1 hypothetical protein DUNSADRAFT_4582 [Dunaliella salina]
MAKERGQSSVEGDVFKWLGHAHNKMGDTKRAEEMFTEGIEFASKADNARLEVECLGGLGCMLK